MRRFAFVVIVAMSLTACDDPASQPPPLTPVATVQLDRDTVVLQRGDTVRLQATLRDSTGAELDRAVAWSSLTPATATVTQSGLVTAQPGGGGSARIVASAEGKSDSATIRVPGEVASVAIDVDTARIEEAAQQQLTATATDAEGLVITGRATIWSSSDPGVATVDALGLVTAIRPGTAQVRARVDGDTGRAAVIVSANHAYDLVFAGWGGTAGQPPFLYRLDMNQPVQAPTQLSDQLGVSDFAISPDGSKYVVAGVLGGVRGLYLMDRSGSNPTLLLNDSAASQPAWSPDGAKIAFRRWPIGAGADIMIMDADGTNVVNLTAVDHGATSQHTPAFSPVLGASYRIAYSHSPGPTAHIWTMQPDGSDKQQLTNGDVFDDSPTWSPNGGGATIAFLRTATDIYVVPASGGNATVFVSLPGAQFSPAWSPDGVLLAFVSKGEAGTFEVFTVRANGTGLARRTVDALDKQEPAWLVR